MRKNPVTGGKCSAPALTYLLRWIALGILSFAGSLSALEVSSEANLPISSSSWTVENNLTIAVCTNASPGHLHETCLDIDKPDTTGSIQISRWVKADPNSWMQMGADIRSLYVGPFAEFLAHVQPCDAAQSPVGAPLDFAFDDGLAEKSEFGGEFKTPQTLGEWKRTIHLFQVPTNAPLVRVSFIFRRGAQQICLDNVSLENLGTQKPPRVVPPVYQRLLNIPGGFLDVDVLVPGFTYELRATTTTTNHFGMGVAAASVNYRGEATAPAELLLTRENGNDLFYRLSVPDAAVEMRFDFHNTDLVTMGPFRDAQYRKWKEVSIRLLARRPAIDTLFYNYIHRVGTNLDLIKPREVFDVSDYDRQVLVEKLSHRKAADAEVKNEKGGMLFVVGGKRLPPMMCASLLTLNRVDVYGELARRELHIVRGDNARGGPSLSGQWKSPGEYDFSSVDLQMYRVLHQDPDALILFNTQGLYPPTWWGDAHPEEILQNDSGLSLSIFDNYAYARFWGKMNGGQLGRAHEAKWKGNNWLLDQGPVVNTTYFPSPASRLYRDAMKDYLTALRLHIESQPYGKAVIGYLLVWGYDMQWGWPVTGTDDSLMGGGKIPPQAVDYSPPMVAGFRAFLKDRYGSVQALQQAWANPKVTFANAIIPTPRQRTPPFSDNPAENKSLKYLLDPATERQVIDYNIYYGYVIGECLQEWAVAVKAAQPRKVIVAAYFQDMVRDLGHDFVLANPGLDISGGPNYEARDIGQSGISPHCYDSYRLHGKADFTEVDHRVFPVMWRSYRGNQVFETPRKSISVLRREFARQMCNGGGAWTLDMGMGWFTQPIMADTLGQIYRVFQRVIKYDRSSPAQMAMFFGDYSYHVAALQGHGTRNNILANWMRAMPPLSGVPVDIYRMADLAAVKSKYKVFIFPLAFGLTDEERAVIESLKREGNLLVFGPAAGFVGSQQLSLDQVIALTGMQMGRDDSLPFTMRITNSTHPITRDVKGFIGSDETDHERVAFPMFHIIDPKCVALGEYVGKGEGRVAMAFKDHGSWQSLYIGAMGVFPPELFRGLARQKGLHIYSEDGDVMFFAKNLIAVHASRDGLKTITLPVPSRVTSLWDDTSLGQLTTIRRDMKTGDNALYLVEPE